MQRKVLYLIKANEDFYDLIRSVMPDDRYELLTLQDGSNGERRSIGTSRISNCRRCENVRKDVDAAVNLRLVLHQGVGYHDTVATKSLMERQIRLAVTPQGTSEGVAEHTIMMMLAVGRRLAFCDSELRKGNWHSIHFGQLPGNYSARQLG